MNWIDFTRAVSWETLKLCGAKGTFSVTALQRFHHNEVFGFLLEIIVFCGGSKSYNIKVKMSDAALVAYRGPAPDQRASQGHQLPALITIINSASKRGPSTWPKMNNRVTCSPLCSGPVSSASQPASQPSQFVNETISPSLWILLTGLLPALNLLRIKTSVPCGKGEDTGFSVYLYSSRSSLLWLLFSTR